MTSSVLNTTPMTTSSVSAMPTFASLSRRMQNATGSRVFAMLAAVCLLVLSVSGTKVQAQANYVGVVNSIGSGFVNAAGIAVDSSGDVFIAGESATVYSVKEIHAVNGVIPLTSPNITTVGGGFNNPTGIAVDASGNVYVADTGNGLVKVMASTCTSSACVNTLGGGFTAPTGVAVDNNGYVYVTDFTINTVSKMQNTCTNSGCVTSLGGGFTNLYGVAVDNSGYLYVTDSGTNLVSKLSVTCANSGCVSTLAPLFTFSNLIGVSVTRAITST